jgi:hypothetical protein
MFTPWSTRYLDSARRSADIPSGHLHAVLPHVSRGLCTRPNCTVTPLVSDAPGKLEESTQNSLYATGTTSSVYTVCPVASFLATLMRWYRVQRLSVTL